MGVYVTAICLSFAIRGVWPAFRLELPAGKLVGYFFIILVLGGPLGEEIGWRGVLQPLLHRKLSPFAASFVIALIWFGWHVPLFWLEGAAQKGGSILHFLTSTTAFSFLFTWLYLRTQGSLFLAVLFHTAVNFVSAVLAPGLVLAWQKEDFSGVLLLAVFGAAAVLFVVLGRKEFFRKPARPAAALAPSAL